MCEVDNLHVNPSGNESPLLFKKKDQWSLLGLKLIVNLSLQEKEEEVNELIQVIKSFTRTDEQTVRPHERMADSLEEAWNDLNVQLEGRRILLDTSVAFHQSVEQVCLSAFLKGCSLELKTV